MTENNNFADSSQNLTDLSEFLLQDVNAVEDQNSKRKTILQNLKKCQKLNEKKDLLNSKCLQIENQILSLKKKEKQMLNKMSKQATYKFIAMFFVLFAIFLFVMINYLDLSKGAGFFVLLFFTLVSFFVSFFTFGYPDIKKHKDENQKNWDVYYKENISPLDEELQTAKNNLSSLTESEVYDSCRLYVGGNETFNANDISTIINLIESNRADDVKEALNKVYDDKDRQKLQSANNNSAVNNAPQGAVSVKNNLNLIIIGVYGILALLLPLLSGVKSFGPFILCFLLGWGGAIIGDFLRKALMPDMIYTRGGFVGLLKAKLFWLVGPQLIGLVIGFVVAGGLAS